MSHSINARVYYEDTDAGGVVYHASYLKYAERGRTELLRFLGFENTSLQDQYGTIFVVKLLNIDYLKTAHLDDLLRIETSIVQMKNASFVMRQVAFRGEETVCAMDVTLVCVSATDYKPVSVPAPVRAKFETFIKGNS